jgi:hypothetical protein
MIIWLKLKASSHYTTSFPPTPLNHALDLSSARKLDMAFKMIRAGKAPFDHFEIDYHTHPRVGFNFMAKP